MLLLFDLKNNDRDDSSRSQIQQDSLENFKEETKISDVEVTEVYIQKCLSTVSEHYNDSESGIPNALALHNYKFYHIDPSKDISEHHNLPTEQNSISKYSDSKNPYQYASRNKFRAEETSLDQMIHQYSKESNICRK